jgi:hypothetical protein
MSTKITYDAGAGTVTLTFKRGPSNFCVYWDGRYADNLATSGAVRERVGYRDILLSWDMPHLVLFDDLAGWAAFEAWALDGGQFKFYPSDALTDYYNCVLEDTKFAPVRNAPGKYAAPVVVRILNDGQAPATPEIVLRRFYGVTP